MSPLLERLRRESRAYVVDRVIDAGLALFAVVLAVLLAGRVAVALGWISVGG